MTEEVRTIGREACCSEIFEDFLDNLIDPPRTKVGGFAIIGPFFVNGFTFSKDSASIVKISGTGGEIWGMKCHNPADYMFYEFSWRWKIDSTTFSDEMMGLIDTDGNETDYCYVLKGTNANTVKFVTVAGGGDPETTDNIACDITTLHDYTIRIKDGQVKFYIDSVLKATHETATPFDVTQGLTFLTTWATARDWCIDTFSVLLRRPF